ncbi:MAG: hypothetical protein FK733_07020 [Asgard group archaeon]|nr:hypothetical protein [Asgard group archaeon]
MFSKKSIIIVYILMLMLIPFANLELASSLSESEVTISDYIFSTFYGGTGSDYCFDSIIDSEGNIIFVGSTTSTNFPTINAYQTYSRGGVESYITKISADGQEVIFSTFLGGGDMDILTTVALDNYGNIVVTGETSSSNFPTLNALHDVKNGPTDIFISKFSPNGTLLYSTFYGGSGYEIGIGLSFDSNNSYVFTGHTRSTDFPVSTDAFQNTFGGGEDDAFLVQISEDGQTLLHSTYLGYNSLDGNTGVIIDDNDCAIICGETNSTNFNTTITALQDTNSGGGDLYLTYYDLISKDILYSSYFGGDSREWPWAMTIDSNSNLIITGTTPSSNYPTSTNAYQETHSGNQDIFVLKQNREDYSLNFSTLLGGTNTEYGTNIETDEDGNVYIIGFSDSSDYPTTIDAYQSSKDPYDDIIISVLNSNGSNLIYSTFIGGSQFEKGSGIHLDQDCNLIVCGFTDSSNFHVENSLQAQISGFDDCFVSKFSLNCKITQESSIPITVPIFITALIITLIKVRKRSKE